VDQCSSSHPAVHEPGARVDAARAEPYLEDGLLTLEGSRYVLTERGMFLANELVLALVAS
jgi:coproporphyrinogen III oxidase-like Fe-S oxidoreductase